MQELQTEAHPPNRPASEANHGVSAGAPFRRETAINSRPLAVTMQSEYCLAPTPSLSPGRGDRLLPHWKGSPEGEPAPATESGLLVRGGEGRAFAAPECFGHAGGVRIRRNPTSRFQPLNRSADWQSVVSRIGNPQCSRRSQRRPTASRRYNGLPTCATGRFMERASVSSHSMVPA